MPVWLITGTSRGIGHELARQLAAQETNTIIATCRSPSSATKLSELASTHNNVHIVALDVLDEETIRDAFEKTREILGSRGIDYLINNAGTAEPDDVTNVSPDVLELAFKTHCVGMLRVFRTFLPLVHAGSRKVVVNVGSSQGSIGCDLGAPLASYSIAKAALHMLSYKMMKQYPELVTFVLEPGFIKTDLTRHTGMLELEPTVAQHIPLFESATQETHGGRFLYYTGKELPW